MVQNFRIVLFIMIFPTLAFTYDFTHSLLDSLLQIHVQDGMVNYQALKQDDSLLKAYLRELELLPEQEYEGWTDQNQIAFWINAYNAVTLAVIIENYPIQYGNYLHRIRFPKNSIRQIPKVWDKPLIRIMGRELSLNQIEHEILRINFTEPRIHFVLVCASMGCPLLDERAFTGTDLDQRLDLAAIKFLNNPEKIRLDKKTNTLFLSQIFNWYKNDFVIEEGQYCEFPYASEPLCAVLTFAARFLPENDVEYIKVNRPVLNFLKYNWSLNEYSVSEDGENPVDPDK